MPDPLDDFDFRDSQRAREEARLPHCDFCDDPIEGRFWVIDEKRICKFCLSDREMDSEDFENWEDEE